MAKATIESVESTINEYYKLKHKYETEINDNKRRIINNNSLSNKEKRYEFQQLKPKCVNCRRPGGTIFSTKFFPSNEKESEYRELRAYCGVIADPCNLDITIRVGKYDLLPDILSQIEGFIKNDKNDIINDKNKLLFGLITSEEALEQFDEKKETINDFTGLLEDYLKHYIDITDNKEKQTELNEDIETSYMLIAQIKECIVNFNETDNSQYTRDAVNIYITTLKPLLSKIATSKYKENMVYYDEDTGIYHLLQTKYNIKSMEYTNFINKVVNFNIGSNTNKKQNIELGFIKLGGSSSYPEEEEEVNIIEPIRNENNSSTSVTPNNQVLTEKILMESFPPKLKFALTYNNEWRTLFIDACLKARSEGQPCEFIPPSNLNFPPENSDDGKWLFGEYHYNTEFNKLPEEEKKRVLNLFTISDGIKNYTPMEKYMNNLVSKSFGFEG
jgi:hypothetical protein